MSSKQQLRKWIIKALEEMSGSASLLDICKYVWNNYEEDLRNSGDLFYTWQYDIRWAATDLRKSGLIKPAKESPRGLWELS
ncbi:hypothetical protein [Sutcliffiella cohnii]|uniref:hypothetical protein n=1 Tax=Sutcliffiella cohnii TaxID=33932 RepID=UPI002E206C54|nr:hypothetical protein [Sutcliffiella cohnii]